MSARIKHGPRAAFWNPRRRWQGPFDPLRARAGGWPWLALCLTLLSVAGPSRAEVCATCESLIQSEFYWFRSPGREEAVPVCRSCSTLPTRCAACSLPIKEHFTKLQDGRLLCRADAAQALYSDEEARRLLAESKHDLFPILSGLGRLPDRNLSVRLVDAREMAQLTGAQAKQPILYDRIGTTRSRHLQDGSWEHSIYLMNGYGPSRLTAVLAHEYAHAWLHENLPPKRDLSRNAVEGFCELVAYKVMGRHGAKGEQEAILDNTYTRASLKILLQGEQQYQFHRVVRWMKEGTDREITSRSLDRLLEVQKPSAPPPVWAPAVATPVPDVLTLKGISGRPGQRFALINNQTLQRNETANIRLGQGQVTVRCLEIGERSVRIQVQGEPGPRQLHLATSSQ